MKFISHAHTHTLYYILLISLCHIKSANGKLVVWVGSLDVWDPLMKGIVMKGGIPRN